MEAPWFDFIHRFEEADECRLEDVFGILPRFRQGVDVIEDGPFGFFIEFGERGKILLLEGREVRLQLLLLLVHHK